MMLLTNEASNYEERYICNLYNTYIDRFIIESHNCFNTHLDQSIIIIFI